MRGETTADAEPAEEAGLNSVQGRHSTHPSSFINSYLEISLLGFPSAKEQELNSAPLPALALHFVAETRQRKGSGVEEEGEETVPSGAAPGCDDALHLPPRFAQDFRPPLKVF